MRIGLFLFLFLTIGCSAAPIELQNSGSPNGKFYLTINPSSDDYMLTSDMFQIRHAKDGKVIAAFQWGQFGPKISPTSAKALWKPDGRAFALTTYVARGWTQSTIYVLCDTKWLEMPSPNFTTKYLAKDGWEGRGKGHFVAVKWLENNSLKMDFYDGLTRRSSTDGQVDSAINDDWVYVRLKQNASGCTLDVWSVEEKEDRKSN